MDINKEKFILVGDPHLNSKQGIRKDDIVQTHINKWTQILEAGKERRANIVVLSDLTDNCDISFSILNPYIDLLKKYPETKVTTAWGNHDEKSDNPLLRKDTALENLISSGVVSITNESLNTRVIYNLDYSNSIHELIKNNDTLPPIFCAHLFYENELFGGHAHNITKSMALSLAKKGVQQIILGHDHKNYDPITLEEDGVQVTIHRPGALFRKKRAVYEFKRNIMVMAAEFDYATEKVSIEYIPVKHKQFMDVISNEKMYEIVKERAETIDDFDNSAEGLLDIFKDMTAESESENNEIMEYVKNIKDVKVRELILTRIDNASA